EQKSGRFREDLYYRLNVVAIALPSLRERLQDVPELVQHFLASRQIGPRPFHTSPEVLDAFARYDWPGNVRELANVLERAQILAENYTITLDDLPENLASHSPGPATGVSADPMLLREVERRHVQEVLSQQHGNKVHAARVLGISRRALYRLIQKYHL